MREGLSIGAFVTFTSMFMHADFWHLFGNMIYLWTFGRRVEDACGAWRYLLFYLAAGMVANIGAEVLNPAHADLPGIGASGAIAGSHGGVSAACSRTRGWTACGGSGRCCASPTRAAGSARFSRGRSSSRRGFCWSTSPCASFCPRFQVIQNGQVVGGVSHLAHMTGFLASILILLFVRKDLLMRYFSGRSV